MAEQGRSGRGRTAATSISQPAHPQPGWAAPADRTRPSRPADRRQATWYRTSRPTTSTATRPSPESCFASRTTLTRTAATAPPGPARGSGGRRCRRRDRQPAGRYRPASSGRAERHATATKSSQRRPDSGSAGGVSCSPAALTARWTPNTKTPLVWCRSSLERVLPLDPVGIRRQAGNRHRTRSTWSPAVCRTLSRDDLQARSAARCGRPSRPRPTGWRRPRSTR